MAEAPGPQYGYDPFASSGKDRWGRRGQDGPPPPAIPNYELIDLLGAGAMGAVWSAKYVPLSQPRAIKFLNPELAKDAALRERFAEEAKALARLDHPSIVKVYDASADPSGPYMAMDFIGGQTLSEIFRTRGLSQEDALRYLGQIAEAIDYAHGMGFTHRDIKPSNVLISHAGRAVLIDFGIATWLGGIADAGAIAGTTRYMSPEACQGKRVTMASDVWAFSVLVYRTLTNTLPFDGANEKEIMNAIVAKAPREPEHPNPRVREVLRSLFAKDPASRPKTASEIVERLREATRPFVTKGGLERIALGTSVLLGGAAVAIIGLIVGGYFLLRPSGGAVTPHRRPSHLSTVPDKGTAAAPPLDEVAGVWYGLAVNQWAELRLIAEPDGALRYTVESRDGTGPTGAESGRATLGPGGALSFDWDLGRAGSTVISGKFRGQLTRDGSSLHGRWTRQDGLTTEEEFVRAINVPTSLYRDPGSAFSAPIPTGWEAGPRQDGNGVETAISPVGRPDVKFSVRATPLPDGASETTTLEQVLQTRGVTGTPRTFAGKQAMEWDETPQEAGSTNRHVRVVGWLNGGSVITVEEWWPTEEAEIWSPILDVVRDKFTLG